ncbi:hypothetical protein SU69_05830 [Thermosipho melanesiensis]|uniref:protein-glutamate methylesterase n=2 Tax=Thermosipho melanesiensis TaxID=46541 RepID=A6LM50_THEM4|nr:chemotaxis protein CheB [Thermosipho melanesiensis]ABR31001.1 hypothetical protein Tmel_1146 [Thermosipho melanesiensis BI429]APT74097.1 chemotaxis protein [Thermosipho melanesiensis]OOC36043.1 hypothetical protein SU68_05900 [Thermosipho melanesiensis]OOC36860.1 hypothetical protein SU69_05830 [Thermosipho melanesiensis]OOC37611.1 hypothetical protein SU70_05840 [Thermosipho melanesiensis]
MNKLIIVGSAGSPNNAIKILNTNVELKIPVILNIHFSKQFIPGFAEHIKKITKQKVTIVKGKTKLSPGIYIPDIGKSLKFLSENTVNSFIYNNAIALPSINTLFSSLIKYANSTFYIFVLSGLGNDGQETLKKLEENNVHFFIQKNPKIFYLTENYRKSLKNYLLADIDEMREILKKINKE